MAILSSLPALSVIDGMKGVVDYYVWMGIPVARSWPRSPGHHRTPPVEAQWPAWTYSSRLWTKMSPHVQEAWRLSAHGTNLSGRDLAMKAYITGYLKLT